jgi:uncharacterized Zn finger protein
VERVKCAICGAEDYNVVLTAEDYRFHTTDEKFNLVRCRQCGLVYVNPDLLKGKLRNSILLNIIKNWTKLRER